MISARYLLGGHRATLALKQSESFHASRRSYTAANPKSRHSTLYSDTLPSMLPVFLLGSAVFLGLQLAQLRLSHEKFMEESTNRVRELEAEIDALQQNRATQLNSTHDAASPTAMSRWRWW